MIYERVSHVQRKLAHTGNTLATSPWCILHLLTMSCAVAALAKEGDWPELLNRLPAMAISSDPKEQQLVFFLIDKLAGGSLALSSHITVNGQLSVRILDVRATTTIVTGHAT